MDDIVYKISSFVAHNHEALKASRPMQEAYSKCINLSSNNAAEMIIETLMYALAEHFAPLEIEEAFQSDEMETILHTLFLKGVRYEH